MANKKSNKKSKRQSHGSGGDDANHDITDERFTAAATRPQFRKEKLPLHSTNILKSGSKQQQQQQVDVDGAGGSLIINNTSTSLGAQSSSSGLGASLTAAIASDDRFKAALNSEEFGFVASRDKYGRKVKKKKRRQVKEEERGVNGEDESDDEGDGDDGGDDVVKERGGKMKKSTKKKKKDTNSDGEDDLEQDTSMEARIAYLNALSRGDISASSSSDESSDSDSNDDRSDKDDDSDDDSSTSSTNIIGKAGIFDPSHKPLPGDIDAPSHSQEHKSDAADQDEEEEEAELTNEPSPHLALLNLNWEHVRAVDIYAMLHSFCPPGTLKKVEVYPSDFGRERMEKERVEGPTGLWKADKKKKNGEKGCEEGDESDGSDSEDESVDEDGINDDKIGNNHSDNEDISDDQDSNSDSEEEEDTLNLAEATAKLYAHFPAQSTLQKNSQLQTPDEEEEGFDIEKLREYEASKLRYYFAIATFTSSESAEVVYAEVDGMEMEDSAAEIDVRVLPLSAYPSTIADRKLRDCCTHLPAKYTPPTDIVATALRQSRVTCSWERGDAERERKLTRWGMGRDAWEALAEGDDVGFYLATSDNSSSDDDDEESDGEEENEEETKRGKVKKKSKKKEKKGSSMRAMLGLAGSDDDDDDVSVDVEDQSISEDSSSGSESGEDRGDKGKQNKKKPSKPSSDTESESESEEEDEQGGTSKQITFTPGKRALEDKIRSKLHSKQQMSVGAGNGGSGNVEQQKQELTPFEKYLEKRKEKRRERRKAARGGKKNVDNEDDDEGMDAGNDDTGMYEVDPEFGMAKFSDEEDEQEYVGGEKDNSDVVHESNDDNDGNDGFFLGESTKKKKKKQVDTSVDGKKKKMASSKEELELLIAGDDDEEQNKDYDMRGLFKLHKNANKKLKGKRKRQHLALETNVTGQDFKINAADDRFAALLDGDDDRFGIDRTNPMYKETGAMKEILEEQSKRRRKKRSGKAGGDGSKDDGRMGGGKGSTKKVDSSSRDVVSRGDDGWVEKSSGAMELSSLVMSLQQKVSKKVEKPKSKKKKKVA